jgi:hypothetical protein
VAEMHVTLPAKPTAIAAPCTLVLTPEARQTGPDARAVLYLLRLAAEGSAPLLNLRSALQPPELARLGRGLRRLVRAGEPFAGLSLGWNVTLRGEPATAGFTVTLTVEESGTTADHAVVATGAAIEQFVDTLEAEVTALR